VIAVGLALAAAAAPAAAQPPRVILTTVAGELLLELYPDVAPAHVQQVLKLVEAGAYDGTHFVRVEPDFVIQLAGVEDRLAPLTAEQRALIRRLPAELGDRPHRPGALSMARRDDDLDSAETSFSILLDFAPHLDGAYTVFGHLERGVEVLREMLRVPRGARHQPRVRLTVLKARVADPSLASGRIPLAVARPVQGPGLDPIRAPEPSPAAAAPSQDSVFLLAIGLMALLSLVAFVGAGADAPRLPRALTATNVLIGVFFLVVLLTPRAQEHPWLALGILAALVATLRLLGRFERARS
jgi:cyclophilin family peptidyl-prolyl cis-trans isomerase